ncbi:MAG: terminase family protein [Candidatus Dojkabacteria bacterium]|nr:terminase family protein [Candidatus Dojkabacteria bacterium]
MNELKDFQKIVIKFPRFLKEAFFNDFKYTVIAAGRQTGKTYNACIWLMINLLQKPNSKGLWVDVTQSNLDRYVERYFISIFKDLWKNFNYNKQYKTLKLFNGSVIDFRSAERSENMEGFNYDFVVLNEAGLILKKSSLWYNTILPMTKNAIVKIIGTPKGRNTFFNLFYLNSPDWKSYKFSAYDSPYWNKEALDKIKLEVPELVFNQEFLAEFQEQESTVFKNYVNCLENYSTPVEPVDGKKYYAGVDLAKHSDFTVISILDETGKQVYFERFNQLDYSFQKFKILQAIQKYSAYCVIDLSGAGTAVYDDLKQVLGHKLIGFTFSGMSKKELIEDLILAFENKKIILPKGNEVQNSELETFSFEISRHGNIIYGAPDGFHDDCVIALALANHCLSENFVKIEIDKEFILSFNFIRKYEKLKRRGIINNNSFNSSSFIYEPRKL